MRGRRKGFSHEGIDVAGLDDVVGFLSREDYLEFAHPYLKEIFSVKATVKIFHNDTDSPVCYEFLRDLGVNVFNFTHLKSIRKARALVGDSVCLMGNVPPREVLAHGTSLAVAEAVRTCLAENAEHPAYLLSSRDHSSLSIYFYLSRFSIYCQEKSIFFNSIHHYANFGLSTSGDSSSAIRAAIKAVFACLSSRGESFSPLPSHVRQYEII